ncbi:hypothetical protein K1719_039359 [Acacia pycnantha]|nr:hypothetical protein K1719_039359 [Acacia pycnantha]
MDVALDGAATKGVFNGEENRFLVLQESGQQETEVCMGPNCNLVGVLGGLAKKTCGDGVLHEVEVSKECGMSSAGPGKDDISGEKHSSLLGNQEHVQHLLEGDVLVVNGVQMETKTCADGSGDGSIVAVRGVSPSMLGASHIVGLGREGNSCGDVEVIGEENKGQLKTVRSSSRRLVEASGSPMKNGEKKKRGRPAGREKAKAVVGSSGKAVLGAANADLGRQLRFLISKYNINLLVLVETRTSGEKCLKLRRKLGFDSSFVEEAQGFSGGIWVLWKSQDVQGLDLISGW